MYDSKYPDNKGTQTLEVTVRVNPNAPIFYDEFGRPNNFYQVRVNESEGIGNTILTLRAEDPDGVSFLY